MTTMTTMTTMTRGAGILTASLVLACTGAQPPSAPSPSAPPPSSPPPSAPSSAQAPAASAEETYTNTVKWATASEVDNFGYDVFRGESAEGPFERLNAEVIEGAGTTDEPTRYRYVDDTIDPRKTYYYYVESISMSGERERFTPVGKARPKIPPAEESEAGDG